MRFLFLLLPAVCIFRIPVSAQQVKYKNLVMEGAGVKGFAYAGALQVLDSLQLLKDIERVGGTSAGAIQAILLAVGYTPAEIMDIATGIPLKKFNDGAWFFGIGLHRLKKHYGYFKGDRILKWIEELIAAKTGNGNITFGELHRLSGTNGYKDLYITGTDLTWQRLVIFSHEQFPGMCIKHAVRISLSIPFYYKPVFIDDNGKLADETAGQEGIHVMVDGGVLSNYPLFLFDSTRYTGNHAAGENRYIENPETLGLLMERPDQLAFNETQPGNSPYTISSMRDYFKALYHTLIDKANPDFNGHYTLHRTIAINSMNLSGRVRRLSKKTVNSLVESGREGVRRFFGEWSVGK